MKRQTHHEKRRTPPAADDPALRRTCTRCYRVRNWTEAFCPCGNPEFMLPEAAKRESHCSRLAEMTIQEETEGTEPV